MSSSRELELKLELPEHDLGRLTRIPALKAVTRQLRKPATLVSIYFDTPNLKLRKNGLSLRVRREGRHYVQTIKQDAAKPAALLDRSEWEHTIRGRVPDLDLAQDSALAPLVSKRLRRELKPLFETRVRRTIYPVTSGDSEIELTVDKGTVSAGDESAPLCEVELELKRGQPSEVFRLARTIAEEVPIQLAVKSKAERGYALIDGVKYDAVKAPHVVLTPKMSREAAFRAIARTCLHQLVANQPAMLGGIAEALHQMRVAVRRLRAAMSLFADIVRDSQSQEMKQQFKWFSDELGPARELDVFIKGVVKPVAEDNPNGAGVAVLADELRQRHQQAYERARAAVTSSRYRKLVLDAAAWIESGDWAHNNGDLNRVRREAPIAPGAAEELARRRKKILKRGARIDELDVQRRHKLRIATKKLRYAAEFFSDVFTANKAARRRTNFLATLEQLQDALGNLNDIAVHEGMAERIMNGRNSGETRRGRHTSKAFAAGRLAGREEARLGSVLEDAQRAYRAFAKSKSFWR